MLKHHFGETALMLFNEKEYAGIAKLLISKYVDIK